MNAADWAKIEAKNTKRRALRKEMKAVAHDMDANWLTKLLKSADVDDVAAAIDEIREELGTDGLALILINLSTTDRVTA